MKRMKNLFVGCRGFTLVEFLIAVVITAVVATVALVIFDPFTRLQETRSARRWSDVENISDAVRINQVDNGGTYLAAITSGPGVSAGTPFMIGTDTGIPPGVGTCDAGTLAVCSSAAIADGDCVDLTVLVTKGYLGAVPVSPTSTTTWDGGQTGYYLTINAKNSVTISACDIENEVIASTIFEEPLEELACVDSDGGVNYGTQGTLIFAGGIPYADTTDLCVVLNNQYMNLELGIFDPGYNVVASCTGEDCRVLEKSCSTDGSPPGELEYYGCPNGCLDGACLPGPSICLNECPFEGAQRCAGGDELMLCGNHDADACLEWEFSACPSGQACNPPGELGGSCTELLCTDSDGGANYSEKGTVSIAGSSSSVGDTDQCIEYWSSAGGSYSSVQSCTGALCALIEKMCSADFQHRQSEIVSCPLGCNDGACVAG